MWGGIGSVQLYSGKKGRGIEMEDIIEAYGSGLLQILGGVCAMALFAGLFADGGELLNIVQQYMVGICG